ncbi:MAG: HD domain-containing protein [Desulfobacteraceae bacterium]|nr:HD domain-containing protein [Desulfobacteraceae bacterium]
MTTAAMQHDIGSTNGQPLGAERTQKLMRAAAGFCDQEGGCHGPDHTVRVHRLALWMGRAMGADLEVLSAAALLHDIGRRDETISRGRICHARRGGELAREILAGLGFEAESIERIVHCIAAHRYRNGEAPASLEAKILFDADKLDSIGAIGIGRAFLFAGQVGARLHNENGVIEGTEPYSVEDTAYREFKVKMSRIRDRMLTPTGRRLAAERHEFMEMFFARLESEINQLPVVDT